MLRIGAGGIRTRTGGDGFDALPLAVTEDALRVESKGFTSALSGRHICLVGGGSTWSPEQSYLLPPSPREWLPEEHLS